MSRLRLRIALMGAIMAPLLAAPARAQTATSEGTVIKNKATATFTDNNNNTYASVSDSVSVTVGFAPGVSIASPASVTPASPSTADTIPFTLTNTGNGTDTLTANVPSVPSGITVTGYRYSGVTYTTLTALNTALQNVSVAQNGTLVVQVIYNVGNGQGGSTLPVQMFDYSRRSATTSSNATTSIQPPNGRAVSVTPKGQSVTQLPTNGSQTYTYTFTVTNNGNSTDSYNLSAAVPTGNSLVSIVSTNGATGTSSSVASVPAGGNVTVDVKYTVSGTPAAGVSDKITLTATSQTDNSKSDVGDVTVTSVKAAVTMAKAAYKADQSTLITSGMTVKPGDTIWYKLTVSNGSSAAPASSVQITDALPSQLTYVSASGDLAANWTISQSAGTVTAARSGTLAAGASSYVWVQVTVK